MEETEQLVDRIRNAASVPVQNNDILLMAEGVTRSELDGTRGTVAALTQEYGYRYIPRLHVDLWNDAPGT